MEQLEHKPSTAIKRITDFLQYLAAATLAGAEDVNTFMLCLLSRVCQPVVFFGLVYWIATRLTPSMIILPWWSMAWPFIQAIAITTYLTVLPSRAIEQAQAGDRTRAVLTILTIVFLAASSLSLISQVNSELVTCLRMLALASIIFMKPEPKPLLIEIISIPISSDDEEDEHPFPPIRVQD